jgi:gamma-glutamyl hercynylcysteine S-oxide synthase
MLGSALLAETLVDARARTLALIDGLSDEQLVTPRLDSVNPFLWAAGHVAWFHDRFALRRLAPARAPLIANADTLYDSSTVPHALRWRLPLPHPQGTLAYLARVQEAMLAGLGRGPLGDHACYLYRLAIFHEDMHGETFFFTRQTLGYPAPSLPGGVPRDADGGPWPGDAAVPGGTFLLGSSKDEPFVFDNEKWAHDVRLAPFRIARAPVTNAEFRAFVEDGGYLRRDLWSAKGWSWRGRAAAAHPVYWIPDGGAGWRVRAFDREQELRPHRPVTHVNWYEADAYCRWADRRLPSEAEWEAAAAGEATADGGELAAVKRRYPWGSTPPDRAHANLDGLALGDVDVAACGSGDSAFGCRQMIGNVWEWTADDFLPYPGFAPDDYEDYSKPWFGMRKVLRGGAWMTRGRLVNCAYRNFFPPQTRELCAGFRTCAR